MTVTQVKYFLLFMTKFTHTATGILFHSFIFRSDMFWTTQTFTSPLRFFIRLRSGEWFSHSRTLKRSAIALFFGTYGVFGSLYLKKDSTLNINVNYQCFSISSMVSGRNLLRVSASVLAITPPNAAIQHRTT